MSLDNKEILKQIKLYADLLELQGESSHKIRAYHNAVFNLEKYKKPLAALSYEELKKLPGIGEAIAKKIDDACQNGIFHQLKDTLEQVPSGVVDMLDISGLGIKKIRTLWQEHGIEDLDQLEQACENDQVAELKGFGAKTQENILQALRFRKAHSNFCRISQADALAEAFEDYLHRSNLTDGWQLVGELRRRLPLIGKIQYLSKQTLSQIAPLLEACPLLDKNEQATSPLAWRGKFKDLPIAFEWRAVAAESFAGEVIIATASSDYLAAKAQNQPDKTLLQVARSQRFASEQAFYESLGIPFTPAERRETSITSGRDSKELLQLKDIKGILHAHSTYSDGKYSLRQMAEACQAAGYEYLGITDHSKSAFYANGLYENRVRQQHQEIEQINSELSGFRIFKGIESDILADGSLDYEADVLASFDFVIASIHSGLKMNEAKATERLIKAIENPYTNILGHPTGRVLLRREGYPINHAKIIEACAQNNVVIEINASPYRLDLDWQWVAYALEQGVMLSINPDAHDIEGIKDTRYGVDIGRKGGLTAEKTLNTRSAEALAAFFKQQR